jgi:hypothetical protein
VRFLSYLVVVAAILLGAATSAGLTSSVIHTQLVLVALVTLVSAQLLAERIGVLRSIEAHLSRAPDPHMIALRSRSEPGFKRFAELAEGAEELLIVGVDLGFVASADAWFIKRTLELGCDVKLLMIDPASSGSYQAMINAHDERNRNPAQPVHDHAKGAADALAVFKSFADGGVRGTLEVRARVDIPNPTITFVDPHRKRGLIRVEIKPYKGNHGDVPYFTLNRQSPWYDVFLDRYYGRLWKDSSVLFSTNGTVAKPPTVNPTI